MCAGNARFLRLHWTVFVYLLTLGVVALGNRLSPWIAVMTGVKATLLTMIVGVVGVVSANVSVRPSDDWAAWLHPFLLSTVALGACGPGVAVFRAVPSLH